MATQYYQFAFTFPAAGPPPAPATMTTTFLQSGANGSQPYQEPDYNGQKRSGGPNPGGGGNYLVVSPGDSICLNLQGPSGWAMPAGSFLQVIISQANSPGPSQGYSPFPNGYVYYELPPGPIDGNGIMQFQLPDQIQASANPGRGNFNRYEITIAFSASASNATGATVYHFADDPEMDVQGA